MDERKMKTVQGFPHRSFVLALVLSLSAGSFAGASEPPSEPASPATMAPPPPGVVLLYEPKTLAETEAVVKLALEDQEIRLVIAKAEEDAFGAVGAYRRAAFTLTGRAGRSGSRATKQELEALYKAAAEKVMQYRGLIQTQLDRYEKFLATYPDDWFQRHRYAWFLADNHLEEDAAAEWRRVIEQAPTFPYAYNNLGTLYNHMGRDLEAMLLYRKAIELYPEDAGFYANLAVDYSTHRAEASKEFGWDLPRVFRECIEAYRRARELTPKDPEIAYDLASQYVLAKFFGVQDTADDAIAAWEYYLALDLTPRQRGAADRNLATIYFRQKNDPAAAQRLLEEALTLLPGDATCKMLLDQAKAAKK